MPVELRGGITGTITHIHYAARLADRSVAETIGRSHVEEFEIDSTPGIFHRLQIQPYGTQELLRNWTPPQPLRVTYSSSVAIVPETKSRRRKPRAFFGVES
jgi:hypothetical protein